MLGKHSGRHALSQRANDLGYKLTREELDDFYHRFCAVADHRKKGAHGSRNRGTTGWRDEGQRGSRGLARLVKLEH